MPGIFGGQYGGLPKASAAFVTGEEIPRRRQMQELQMAGGLLGMQQAQQQQAFQAQQQPLQLDLLRAQVAQAQGPQLDRVDLGNAIGLIDKRTGALIGQLPKQATPDTMVREQGATQRHEQPGGAALLGAQTTIRGQDIGAQTAFRGQDITLRGQDLQEGRERFGPPQEVTVGGRPALVMQNRKTGELLDPNTQNVVAGAGPKIGETAQKQQTGVANVKDAITEYRTALKGFGATDIINPAARARMGTIYNNMLLQAKEAYNLGVLNGPDYAILQEVITNPASVTGAVTPKKDLDAQAAKLDEIMSRVGGQVTTTQTGQTPRAPQGGTGGFRVLGVER